MFHMKPFVNASKPREAEPVDDGPTLAELGVAALFVLIAAIIVLWLVYLPFVGGLYLLGALS